MDCYLPSTTQATATNILTKYANTNVDLNSFYAKSSYGTSGIYKYKISTGADIGTIFNLWTADVTSMNNPITNTLLCAVLRAHGMGLWGTVWGITGTNPFNTTSWTNYWIQYTSDFTHSNNLQYSFQQCYISAYTSPISASIIFLCDNYADYLYINYVNILPSRIDSTATTLNLTLFPGTNLIDFYCQNMEGSAYAGLIFM